MWPDDLEEARSPLRRASLSTSLDNFDHVEGEKSTATMTADALGQSRYDCSTTTPLSPPLALKKCTDLAWKEQPAPSSTTQPLTRLLTRTGGVPGVVTDAGALRRNPASHHEQLFNKNNNRYRKSRSFDDYDSTDADIVAGSPLTSASIGTMEQSYNRDTWRMYERIQQGRCSSNVSRTAASLIESALEATDLSLLEEEKTDNSYAFDTASTAYATDPSEADFEGSEGIFELEF